MGGLSFWHVVVIAMVLALVLAHRHLPAALGALGSAIGRFRHGGRKPRDDGKTIEGTFVRRDG